jgi:hypothetical protein
VARAHIIAFAMLAPMNLDYLLFDHSEDTEGVHTFEAMASVGPSRWEAVRDEAAEVLRWAHQVFPGERGALEEGGEWDFDLQGVQEFTVAEVWVFDEARGELRGQSQAPGLARHTLTLTLTGTERFAQALTEALSLDD